MEETQRCPQCADPVCHQGCPLEIDIRGFIRLIREGNTTAALKKIKEENPLPAICGRICPAPCERSCIFFKENMPIEIRALERYAVDAGQEKILFGKPKICKGKKIAVIGSGPMGLSAAAFLAQKDYQVTIFEAMEKAGGVLRYGIPEFRLPPEVIDEELHSLRRLGVEIKLNSFFNQREKVKQLFKEGFATIVLTLGGGRPIIPELPGLSYGGVYFAQEFLMRVHHFNSKRIRRDPRVTSIGHKLVVIGSNHAALDCARIAVRMGREAAVIFPHLEDDMKVSPQELLHAKEEGVKIEPLTKPLSIMANDQKFVQGVKCQHMDFADPQASGQWQLLPVGDSEFVLAADTVIVALGQQRNEMIEELVGLEGVFVPEQSLSPERSVVDAIAAGKKIALQMDEYLKKIKK